jgi:hypothetical protein
MFYLVTVSNSVAVLLLTPLNVWVYCRFWFIACFVFLSSMALNGRCMFWYIGYCLCWF